MATTPGVWFERELEWTIEGIDDDAGCNKVNSDELRWEEMEEIEVEDGVEDGVVAVKVAILFINPDIEAAIDKDFDGNKGDNSTVKQIQFDNYFW